MRRLDEPVKLDNGATLVLQPSPKAPAVALAVTVRVGLTEDGAEGGMTALLTRMLGAEAQGRTGPLLQSDIDAFGGMGIDYDGEALSLWAVSVPDPVEITRAAQTLLLNTLTRPLFSDEQLAAARRAVLRERAVRADSLTTELLARLRARAVGSDAGYLGDDETLARVTLDKVRGFHARWCRPERSALAVTGRAAPDPTRDLVQSLLNVGGWKELPKVPAERPQSVSPVPSGLRDAVLERRGRASAVGIGYLAPGTVAGADRWATLLLLDAVIGQGKASRLFALRERDAVGYELRSVVSPGRTASVWCAYILGDRPPTAGRDALRGLCDALGKGSEPIVEAELAHARMLLKGQRLQSRQTLVRQARAIAWGEAMGLSGLETDYDRILDRVSLEAVNALAKSLFSTNPVLVRTP